ncbi:MAG TPA: MFS transporter [Actinomycetota bacterium]|nr:MFS transporter [Actinomycetota bacterium]
MRRPQVSDAVQVRGLFLFFGFVIASFFPFFSLYLREYHGLDEAQIGTVLLIAGALRAVANPVWGHQADTRLGRLTVLQIGLVGSGLAALWLNGVDGLAMVALASAIHSMFLIAQGSNLDAITLAHLGDGAMQTYGRVRMWESATYGIGCLLFGAILQAAGMGWAMPLYAASVALVLLWSTTVPRDRARRLEESGRFGAVGQVFKEAPRLWGFLAAVFLVWTGFNAAWNFIGLRIDDAGGGPLLIGLGAALGGAIEVPTMWASSRMQTRWGLRNVYVLGCLVYATGFLLWGSVDDATTLSLLTGLEGIGFSLLFTTAVVVIGRLVPEHLYSSGNSITGTVGFGIAPILGAFVGGIVYQELGSATTFILAAVLAALGAVVAWFALSTPELCDPIPAEPVVLPSEAGPLA